MLLFTLRLFLSTAIVAIVLGAIVQLPYKLLPHKLLRVAIVQGAIVQLPYKLLPHKLLRVDIVKLPHKLLRVDI